MFHCGRWLSEIARDFLFTWFYRKWALPHSKAFYDRQMDRFSTLIFICNSSYKHSLRAFFRLTHRNSTITTTYYVHLKSSLSLQSRGSRRPCWPCRCPPARPPHCSWGTWSKRTPLGSSSSPLPPPSDSPMRRSWHSRTMLRISAGAGMTYLVCLACNWYSWIKTCSWVYHSTHF